MAGVRRGGVDMVTGRGVAVTIDARMLHVSGIGTYLRELVPRVIAAWPSAQVTLLGHPDELEAMHWGRKVTLRACRAAIYSPREQLSLARAIPARTDLFWAPHYNIPLLFRGALAVTVHDVNHLAMRQHSLSRRAYARAMFAAIRRRASLVLCDSRFTADELRRRVGAIREMEVVHLGVAPSWFDVRDAPPSEVPYFLYVGNVKPHKNLPRLLEAFSRVRDVIPHQLVIVGRRDGFRTADDRAVDVARTLGDRVRFTGHVEVAELEGLVMGCDALVLPSLYEGFGLPALEALACGRALAVSNVASLPEVCGAHAEYFDPYDVADIARALVQLANRPPDAAGLRAARRAWARGFDWDRCAASTGEALRRAAAGPRGGGAAPGPVLRQPSYICTT